jgi:hypothetical protein
MSFPQATRTTSRALPLKPWLSPSTGSPLGRRKCSVEICPACFLQKAAHAQPRHQGRELSLRLNFAYRARKGGRVFERLHVIGYKLPSALQFDLWRATGTRSEAQLVSIMNRSLPNGGLFDTAGGVMLRLRAFFWHFVYPPSRLCFRRGMRKTKGGSKRTHNEERKAAVGEQQSRTSLPGVGKHQPRT